MGELNNFRSYREACVNKAQRESAIKGITNVNIELYEAHLRELKSHEDEIRRVRQELETRLQRNKLRKIISMK